MDQQPSSENLEIIHDFLSESREMLDNLDPSLMKLEELMTVSLELDEEIIHEIFRTFHSMKGAASFLKYNSISRLTHHAESLLDRFRKGLAVMKSQHVQVLYETGDLLKALLNKVDETFSDEGLDKEVDHLVHCLNAGLSKAGEQARDPEVYSQKVRYGISEEILTLLEDLEGSLLKLNKEASDDNVDVVANQIHSLRSQFETLGHREMSALVEKLGLVIRGVPVEDSSSRRNMLGILHRMLNGFKKALNHVREGLPTVDFIPPFMEALEDLTAVSQNNPLSSEKEAFLGNVLTDIGVITSEQLQEALRRQDLPLGEMLLEMELISRDQLELGLQVQSAKRAKMAKKESGGFNIRVDLRKLDQLGNLVGELIIAENMVTHHPQILGSEFEEFRKTTQSLDRISRDIQDLVMNLRMVPIKNTFQKMTRVIRDVSQKQSKTVDIVFSGEETEIDKNVVENLSSPLIHIVRNAVDHGLETPDERRSAGKNEMGSILLSASQEGGEVRIMIRDDGRGMNKKKILEKALERGLIEPDKKFKDDEEIFDLIFSPGFSTASEVTDISGRGVGMDVVKKNVERLSGRISVSSLEGHGSVITLNIPLTLSIIEGMLVRVNDAIFTIPLANIRESFAPKGYKISKNIDGSESILIRGRLAPIIRLGRELGVDPVDRELNDGILVMVEFGDVSACLFVDDILGQRQTVIKRVSKFFGDIRGVSGFSILSDGDITLILDVGKLLNEN